MDYLLNQLHHLATPIEKADCLPYLLGPRYGDVARGRFKLWICGSDTMTQRIASLLRRHHIPVCGFFAPGPSKHDPLLGLMRPWTDLAPALTQDLAPGIQKKAQDIFLLITAPPDHAISIKAGLEKAGWPPEQLHIPDHDHLRFYSIASKLHWSPQDLAEQSEALEATWNLLEDETSRTLFLKRLALLTEGADYGAFKAFIASCAQMHSQPQDEYFTRPRHDEDYFYFNNGFCEPQPGDVFANVGALVGACALEFASTCQRKGIPWKHIYNFEPDPINFQLLEENMAALPDVTSLPFGLWSRHTSLHFSNPGAPPIECPHIKPFGSPGAVDEHGDNEIEVRSLDELLPDSDISFIKMDIEGAELEALRGAQNTIRRNRPKLAISLYHKRNDIFEIPLYLKALNPSYRFYLRHHCSTLDETVVFAVP